MLFLKADLPGAICSARRTGQWISNASTVHFPNSVHDDTVPAEPSRLRDIDLSARRGRLNSLEPLRMSALLHHAAGYDRSSFCSGGMEYCLERMKVAI